MFVVVKYDTFNLSFMNSYQKLLLAKIENFDTKILHLYLKLVSILGVLGIRLLIDPKH